MNSLWQFKTTNYRFTEATIAVDTGVVEARDVCQR